MKESLSRYQDVELVILKRQSHRRTGYAFRGYHQRRVRRRRLLLLGFGALAMFLFSALTAWGILSISKAFFPEAGKETRQLETLLKRDFGFDDNPSLLYTNIPGYAPLHRPSALTLTRQLSPILPRHRDGALQSRLEAIFSNYPAHFTSHLYVFNPQNGTYAEINGYAPVSAASVIKVPVLLHYLLSLDENTIQLEKPLLYADFHRAGGAGALQYKPTGVDLPANWVASEMIRISDNTCTNILISALGGTDAVNRRLNELGLRHTRIRNWLPDLPGTNTISAYEMTTLFYNIDQGSLLSASSRETGLNILKSTHNRRLLVTPLPREVQVAHKTGDIGTSLGDSGAVYLPDGRKYYVSIQVERPFNDYTARDMIQQASRTIYEHMYAQTPGSHLVQAQPNE